jgi:hypothetical protein
MTVTFHGVTDRSAKNDAGSRTYSVTFRLSTNDKADGPFAVGSHPDLPAIGSVWPEDASAYCNSLSVENSDPWRGWHVTATYTDERTYGSINGLGATSGGNPGTGTSSNPYKAEGASSDPVYDEVKYSWAGHTYEEIVMVDAVDGNPILNTAGDPFSEPVTREVTDAICTVSYSGATPPAEVLALQNYVNNAAIEVDGRTFPKRSIRLQNLNVGPRQYRNGDPYRQISYQLKFRQGRNIPNVDGDQAFLQSTGWDYIALSTGFQELYNIAGKLKKRHCKNPDGTNVKEPALLDANGRQISSDDTNLATIQDLAFYQGFRLYPGGDFSLLTGVDAA